MQKPNNYDNTQVGSDFIPIELGGHHAVIKSAREDKSKKGNKPMLVVAIDFAPNDKQPGYFAEQFEKDIRPEKKWPFQAVQYIVVEDSAGSCSKSFKSFVNAFEKSNNTEIKWVDGPAFVAQFKGKRIGAVYGEVEDEYNGEVKTRRRLRWFCVDAVADKAKIPNKQTLDSSSKTDKTITGSEPWMQVPETDADALPF